MLKVGAVMFFTTDSMRPAELAPLLEAHGFESLWVPEHTHIPSSRKTPYPAGGPLIRPYYDIMDPFIALTAAAAVTTRLRLGTGICLVTQRDPIVTAKMVSSLDQLSNGRFIFGVGNGWNQDEIENHGTVFATRNKLARERIEAMQAIWTREEPEYHGAFVNFDPMQQWPKPHQAPHPPIIVGGAFPYGAQRAIRYGNGWIPLAQRLDAAGLGDAVSKFRQMAVEAGRDPASLPVTVFRAPPELDRLRYCAEIGIDRVTFTLPAEGRETLLPIIERWAELQQRLGA